MKRWENKTKENRKKEKKRPSGPAKSATAVATTDFYFLPMQQPVAGIWLM